MGHLGGGGEEEVGEAEEGGEGVALAEVAGGDDGEEEDEGEGKEEGLGVGEGEDAADNAVTEEGDGGFKEEDEGFGGGGDGEVEVLGEGDGEGAEPDDGGRVGVEGLWAVEGGAVEPALGEEEEPELVVTARGDEREDGRHGEGGGDEEAQCG